MLNPERLVHIYRQVKSRKLKVLAVEALRRTGFRHLVIRMDTINLCNLRCKMCYYSSDYRRKKDEMNVALFRRIADEVFPKTRFLYLSCATEPLMNKHFADIIRVTGEYKVPFTSFCTNGQLLTKEVIQACIDARISEIIFSVDGATAETYEDIRRGGKWDRLVERMNLLAAMKQAAGAKYPVIRINFTCMQRNIHELPGMVKFAADRGAQSLHVRHLLTYSDDAGTYDHEATYMDSFNSVASQTRAAANAAGISLFLPDLAPETNQAAVGKTCVTDGMQIQQRSEANPYCMLPWFQAIISWKGDYRICSAHRLGNLQEQSFYDIYNGKKMRELRSKMLWRTSDSCSWDCREEAYDIPEQVIANQQSAGVAAKPELAQSPAL